jgi:hypothetical protein
LLAKKIGGDLCAQIPIKLGRLGIQASATVAYQQSAYLCIEVIVGPVSLRNFFEKNAHLAHILEKYNNFMAKVAWTNLEDIFDRLFTNFIGQKMLTQIPNMVISKLQLKLSAKLELIVCKEEEQGDFLISTIQELNNKTKAIPNETSVAEGKPAAHGS